MKEEKAAAQEIKLNKLKRKIVQDQERERAKIPRLEPPPPQQEGSSSKGTKSDRSEVIGQENNCKVN